MRFVKVEGAGNDYVLVEGPVHDPAALAGRVSDRHLGIGSDGLLLIGPPEGEHHASMRIFNADGSEGRMCGNGLRCVVRWLVERRGVAAEELSVQTASGPRRGRLEADGTVSVTMGEPSFLPELIPADLPRDGQLPPALPTPAGLAADPPLAFAVGTGNPHLVVRVPDVEAVDLEAVGVALGSDPRLPEGANVHVVQREGAARLRARPFERGSGATQACGTGAVAVAAVARALGWTDASDVTVAMPGDTLGVRWTGEGEAWLSGPAHLVFDGEWPDS